MAYKILCPHCGKPVELQHKTGRKYIEAVPVALEGPPAGAPGPVDDPDEIDLIN
jgi:hypothetical protein